VDYQERVGHALFKVYEFGRIHGRRDRAAQSAIPAMLPQLLRDIQSNAAIGEPAWSDIERRIGEVQVALASRNDSGAIDGSRKEWDKL